MNKNGEAFLHVGFMTSCGIAYWKLLDWFVIVANKIAKYLASNIKCETSRLLISGNRYIRTGSGASIGNALNRMYAFSCVSRRDVSYLSERLRSPFCVCQETELIALHALKRLVQLVGDITTCFVNKKHSLLKYPILESLVCILGDILFVVCMYIYLVQRFGTIGLVCRRYIN